MKKIVLIISFCITLMACFACIRHLKKQSHRAKFTIGIIQTASHPALDAARDGFIEEIKNTMGNTVEIIIKNAQGSVAQAHTIAQQFKADKTFKAFFALATPAAQALATVEKERPIIIAAVTDPYSLGLIHPTTNVSGVHDMINVRAEITLITQLIPSAKTVGLIYTSGETNSIALIKLMHQELEKVGLQPIDFAITHESDLQAQVELACRKTDLLLAPTDNTIASAISFISNIALRFKKPLIVSDVMLAPFGPLAAYGVDYNLSGKEAAQFMQDILVNGKHPSELPLKKPTSNYMIINKKTLAALELTIPKSLENQVKEL